MAKSIQAQNDALFGNKDTTVKKEPWMAIVWNWFMTLMIGYFIVSFLNQITRNYLNEH